MKQILKGYASLFRELLGLPNDGAFLTPPGLFLILVIGGVIGFLRNALSIALGAPHGFYSFEPDILWSVVVFPIHLAIFPPALLHAGLRFLGEKNVDVDSLLGLGFYLQIVHIIVPFIDTIGFALSLPPYYVLGSRSITNEWYTNRLYMSPGIILGWWITGYAVARVLITRFQVRWIPFLVASLVSYLIVLIPTYLVFPTINTLFSRAFGPYLWNPLDYLFVPVPWFPLWGYCTYFVLTALAGLIYISRHSGIERSVTLFQVRTAGRAYAWLLFFGVIRSILDYVWVPMFAGNLYKSLVLFNYTVYQFTLFLLIPAIAGFVLERVFSRPVNAAAVLRESVLVWLVYPAVPIISLILRSPASQTIEWFRYIPTFMVDDNFLPAGMIAIIPVLIIFYTTLMIRHSRANWFPALASVLVSLWAIYLLYYQYALRLFLYAHSFAGAVVAAGVFTLTFLIPLFPVAGRFHIAFGRHPVMLPRVVMAWTLISVGLIAVGLFLGS